MIASKLCPDLMDRDMKSAIAVSCAAIFPGASSHRLMHERHTLSSFNTVNATGYCYHKTKLT